MPTIFTQFHHHTSKRLRKILIATGITAWLAASLLALAPILPHLLYRLSPQTPNALAQTIGQTITTTPSTTSKSELPLPPKNTDLPEKNLLIIDQIGVQGPIHQGENWQEILKKGIWITPNWGTPPNNQHPIIIASHRWGYLDWSRQFRRQNSFYNLPQLKPNDQIKIIWNQREYIYQVYKSNQGEKPTDLDADLILYTCKLFNSPIRIFYYAKRV